MQLIDFRAIQGLSAGAILPIALTVAEDAVPPRQRAWLQRALLTIFGLTVIVGPMLGGWLIAHGSWRLVFVGSVPAGFIALLSAGMALPGGDVHRRHVIDYRGVALLAAAAVSLLLALSSVGRTAV